MTARTVPLTFACGHAQLVGLLHLPDQPKATGVVVVAGAPQYRAGSHRHFVLLARDLSAAGFPVLRFDYRGMGDSDGDFVGFECIEDDIRAAVDAILAHVPGLHDVVLWGLCDGATAISFCASRDPRISGVALVNPWARSEESLAEARLAHYYRWRLVSPEFWRKLVGGRMHLTGSARELVSTARTALAKRLALRAGSAKAEQLPLRIARSIETYQGRVLIILSGGDLAAREFDSAVLKSPAARRWRDRSDVTLRRIDLANHTYATGPWRAQVHRWTTEWLEQHP